MTEKDAIKFAGIALRYNVCAVAHKRNGQCSIMLRKPGVRVEVFEIKNFYRALWNILEAPNGTKATL